MALLAAFTLVAAGCGGTEQDTTTTSNDAALAEAEARIQALEEQLAQDSDGAQGEDATTTPTTVTTETPPDGAENDDADEPESLVDRTTTSTTPDLERVFALPSGPTLQQATSPLDVRAIMQTLLGPTDDFASSVARLAPYPAVPTLPDTEVTRVTVDIDNDFRDDFVPNGYEQSSRVEGTSSAQVDDAELALNTALAAAGFELEQQNTVGSVRSNTFDNFDDGRLNVQLSEGDDGGTEFKIAFVIFSEIENAAFVADSADWTGDAPFGEGILDMVSLDANSLPDFRVDVQHLFLELDEEQAEAQFVAGLENSVWTREFAPVTEKNLFRYPDDPGTAEFFGSDIRGVLFQSFVYSGSVR